jgi:hypothetical protein
MRNLVIIVLLVIIPAFVSAQSKKEIKEAGIKKITEYKYDYKTGKEKKMKASEISYDGDGNEVEVIEYDDFGKVTRHEKTTYNSNDDKTSVIEFDAAGKIKKTTKYTYFGKYKTGKEVYDASNKLISKKTYEYVR